MTAAGKTFTVEGTQDDPGVLPRSLALLFDLVKSRAEEGLHVVVTYYEVYNENIYDLLGEGQKGGGDWGRGSGKSKALEIKEDAGRVFLKDITQVRKRHAC